MITTLALEQFFHADNPSYAILSHTWEPDEITLQDVAALPTHQGSGFAKVRGTCVQALAYGLEYVWIDTCCIDKTSSAELSEAINSKFRWY